MKITPGRIGCALLALWGLSLLSGNPEGAEYAAQSKQTKALVTDSRRLERDALKLSSVALARFRRGCLPVVLKDGNGEAFHSADAVFTDKLTGKTLPAGTEICNGRGWTAITQEDGTATDVAVATPQDSNSNQIPDNVEAQEIFKKL